MGAKNDDKQQRPRRRPATTPEGRESRMVAMAVDLAEKQLANGTASAQVISHYLKLGSTREKLEQARLENENLLLTTKVETMRSAKRMEDLYSEAIDAMRQYAGQDPLTYEE